MDRVVVRLLVAAVIAPGAMANLAASAQNAPRGSLKSVITTGKCPVTIFQQVYLLLFVELLGPHSAYILFHTNTLITGELAVKVVKKSE